MSDTFAAAFDLLAELGDKEPSSDSHALDTPNAAPPVEAAASEPEAKEPEAASVPEAPDSGADQTHPPEAGDPTPEVTDPGPAKVSDDELLSRFARIVKETPSEPAAPTAPAPAPAPADVYSPEEKTFLADYEKDWPDVAKAETLRRRGEYQQLVGYVFQEVAKELSPVLNMVRTLTERTHLSDLQSTVTDYGDVRDKVIDWVGKQPSYLQAAYNHVIQSGTVTEVADLIDRYKQATGARPAPVASKPDVELPPAAKKAAAALAPVASKRSSAVSSIPDSNDFEGAFKQFADLL